MCGPAIKNRSVTKALSTLTTIGNKAVAQAAREAYYDFHLVDATETYKNTAGYGSWYEEDKPKAERAKAREPGHIDGIVRLAAKENVALPQAILELATPEKKPAPKRSPRVPNFTPSQRRWLQEQYSVVLPKPPTRKRRSTKTATR